MNPVLWTLWGSHTSQGSIIPWAPWLRGNKKNTLSGFFNPTLQWIFSIKTYIEAKRGLIGHKTFLFEKWIILNYEQFFLFFLRLPCIQFTWHQGYGLFPNYGYADPLLPLRSGHVDIRDGQCAKKMMSVKFHITSYRVWPKIQLPSKVAKFAE